MVLESLVHIINTLHIFFHFQELSNELQIMDSNC